MANVKIRGLPTFSSDFSNESTDFLIIAESGSITSNIARTSKISISKLKQYTKIEDANGDTKFTVHPTNNTAFIECNGGTSATFNEDGLSTTGTVSIGGKTVIEDDLDVSGDIVAFYSSSDKRLKDNIEPISDPIEKIKQVNGISFDWKENLDPLYSGKDYGVLAQEIETILPEAVRDKKNGFKSLNYNSIIPLLIECIKNQENRIKELEKICQSKA